MAGGGAVLRAFFAAAPEEAGAGAGVDAGTAAGLGLALGAAAAGVEDFAGAGALAGADFAGGVALGGAAAGGFVGMGALTGVDPLVLLAEGSALGFLPLDGEAERPEAPFFAGERDLLRPEAEPEAPLVPDTGLFLKEPFPLPLWGAAGAAGVPDLRKEPFLAAPGAEPPGGEAVAGVLDAPAGVPDLRKEPFLAAPPGAVGEEAGNGGFDGLPGAVEARVVMALAVPDARLEP